MTAADLTRSVLAGLAIAALICGVFYLVRPYYPAPPVFVPAVFTPAPVPSCTGPAPRAGLLHGRPDCAEVSK